MSIGAKTLTAKATKHSQSPYLVDLHAGPRLRLRRHRMGISQEDLGQRNGVLLFNKSRKEERGC